MKPWVIPWPQAGMVTSNPPSNKLATNLEILDFIHRALLHSFPSPRSDDRELSPEGSARVNVSAKFYLVAMFFVIFDLEAVVIFAWAIAPRELSWGADPIADGIVTTPAPEAGNFTNGEYVSRVSLGELDDRHYCKGIIRLFGCRCAARRTQPSSGKWFWGLLAILYQRKMNTSAQLIGDEGRSPALIIRSSLHAVLCSSCARQLLVVTVPGGLYVFMPEIQPKVGL